MIKKMHYWIVFLAWLMPGTGAGQPSVTSEFLLRDSVFGQCHASTLVSLPDGEILVAFFAGKYEGSPDVKIWAVKGVPNHWSEPFELANGSLLGAGTFPCWNPVLHLSRDGTLYLFYKVGRNPREWVGMMKTSKDHGKSWGPPQKLPDGFLGPVRSKPLDLPDGSLLCPSSIETETHWSCHMEKYDPAANLWSKTGIQPEKEFNVIQPTLLNRGSGHLIILCRSKSNRVAFSQSYDSGNTWTPLDTLSLPNPNSAVEGLSLDPRSHWLVYNPLTSGREWWEGRNRLVLGHSVDGLHWDQVLVLEEHPKGEFSYPAMIKGPGRIIYVTYTYDRRNIRFLKITV